MLSLNKYLYAESNPINRIDPTGNMSLIEMTEVAATIGLLATTGFVITSAQFASLYKEEGGRDSDAYLLGFDLSIMKNYGVAGVGVGASLEWLYFKEEERWGLYLSVGPTAATNFTPSTTVSASAMFQGGEVWNVKEPNHYKGIFLIAGSTSFPFGPFPETLKMDSVGGAASLFWGPMANVIDGVSKKSFGYSFSGGGGNSGSSISFGVRYYFLLLDDESFNGIIPNLDNMDEVRSLFSDPSRFMKYHRKLRQLYYDWIL